MVGASEELEMGYEKDCASIVYSMRFGRFFFLSWCLSPPPFFVPFELCRICYFFQSYPSINVISLDWNIKYAHVLMH